MADLSQAEFARAARGGSIRPGRTPDIAQVVKGCSSVARKAVRESHKQSPAVALAYFNGMVAKWLLSGGRAAATAQSYATSLNQYLTWDGGSGAAETDLGLKASPIGFGSGNSVRAIAHVVRDLGNNTREARVLFWDDLVLDQNSAEMIALPVLDRVIARYGPAVNLTISVWHLAAQQQFRITPTAAQAQRSNVTALLASL